MARLVTVDNFTRAATDRQFAAAVRVAGGVGRLHHDREVVEAERQTVVWANRDIVSSMGVFDLEAGPVSVGLPEVDGRFVSMMVIDEDHHVQRVVYGFGPHPIAREDVVTRYAMVVVRIFVTASSPSDVAHAHSLQDAIEVQQVDVGSFDVPGWDRASEDKVCRALLALSETLTDTRRMFGRRDEVDPVRHLVGTAAAWGGHPERDATFLVVTPAENDGRTPHQLRVTDVPVDGFWSISVYNAAGHFEPNDRGRHSVDSVSADRGPDDSVTVRFGGDEGANHLPICPGWNYWVRLYRPRPEILDGTWTFPRATVLRRAASRRGNGTSAP